MVCLSILCPCNVHAFVVLLYIAAAGNGGDPYVDPNPPPTEQTTSEPMETASVEEISNEKAEVKSVNS